MYDAIVIGGGPAGLQAALTLGRMHRRTLLLDSGHYRNDPADAMHNFLTRDGTDPADLRAAVRQELKEYPDVEVRDLAAEQVSGELGRFVVTLAGGQDATAARLLLATGVRDTLPPIPGVAELFGSVVAHCPFCHGHEYAGGRVVIQETEHAAALAEMVRPIAAEVVVGYIADLRRGGSGAIVTLTDGTVVDATGVFVQTAFAQSAPFAEQLGLKLLDSGCIEVDGFGRTSVPGVYAAGDLAHTAEFPMPMASVLNAAAAGLLAGASVVRAISSTSPPEQSSTAPR